MNTISKQKFWFNHYFLLFVITILGYWQIAFLYHPPKFDMIDCFYPWRYMVSENIRNGLMPLWNPYQKLGYPIHADPQSAAWYPITWLISLFYGYNIYSLSFEFILHVFLAAVGMYKLAQALSMKKEVAFFMAISYLFSGFIIGNAQHFTYVISATWIPFILASYINMEQSSKLKYALMAALFMSLLFSGGYPAFSFVFIYLLIILFSFYTIQYLKEKNSAKLFVWIKQNALFAFVFLILSAVSLVSIYGVMAHINRGEGLSLSKVLFGPFSPQCSISFLLPFAAIKNMDFFDTDLSMSNAYIGIVPFILFIGYFFIKKTKIINVLFVFGAVSLIAAFGAYTPLREFLYQYVPLMNLFRFPSMFRLFTIISFIIAGGYYLNTIETLPNKKTILIITTSIILFFTCTLFYARLQGYLTMSHFIKNELFIFSRNSFLLQHVAFQSIIQILICIVCIVLWIKIKNSTILIYSMSALLVADLFIATQLNAAYTVFSQEFKTEEVKKFTNAFPEKFPIPENKNVSAFSDTTQGLAGTVFWKNLNTFHKNFAFDGFNSFGFKNYEYLQDSLPNLFLATIQNKPLFLASTIYPTDSLAIHRIKKINPSTVYLNAKDYNSIKNKSLKQSVGDTILINSFSPNKIECTVKTENAQLLTLLQNNYNGWKLTVNGKAEKILTSNLCFMSAQLNPGINNVVFYYSPTNIYWAAVVSLAGLIVVISVLIYPYFRK